MSAKLKIDHAYMVLSRGDIKRMLAAVPETQGDITCGVFDVTVAADDDGSVQVMWNNWARPCGQHEFVLSGHPEFRKEIKLTKLHEAARAFVADIQRDIEGQFDRDWYEAQDILAEQQATRQGED